MGHDLFSGTLGIIIILVTFVAAILWFFLPFAVFGMKARIDELIQINKKSSVLLESVNAELVKIREASNAENKTSSRESD